MLIVRNLGTPNSDFNGCHCMRDPVLYRPMGSTCSEECLSLAHLNLIRQSCVVHRQTFVQLGESFRRGATTSAML